MTSDTSQSLFERALKEILAANYAQAELMLEQAADLNEGDTTLYAASWAVLLAMRERPDEAISILEERLEENSTDPHLLLAYALTLDGMGNLEDAEDAYREVLEQEEDNPGALRGMAKCLQARGDVETACKLAAKAYTLAPENLILAKSAIELLEATGQEDTASEVVDLAANYNPDDEELVSRAIEAAFVNKAPERVGELLALVDESEGWAAGWKANYYNYTGETKKAEALIARTLSRPAGNNPTFLYQAACVAYKGGDLDEASRLLEMILEQDPQHTSALRLLSDIDQGREEIDPNLDPLLKVVPVSSEDLDGWQLFWFYLDERELEEAEEVLGQMAETPEYAEDVIESARLELAEAFLMAMHSSHSDVEFPSLEELPVEIAGPLLLEFLDAVETQDLSLGHFRNLHIVYNQELGRRDPILLLNRLYARQEWDSLGRSIEELLTDADNTEEQPETPNVTYTLYSALHALAVGDEQRLGGLEEQPMSLHYSLFDILSQKQPRNQLEESWFHKLESLLQNRTSEERLPPQPDPSGSLSRLDVNTGVLDFSASEFIDENEMDEEFDPEEYEEVDEDDDDDDENYEYVWVEDDDDDGPEEPLDRY